MTSLHRKKQKHAASFLKLNASQKVFSVGEFIWGKLTGCKWWPAIVIDPFDVGRKPAKCGHTWVFWFGDHKISEIPNQKILNFMPCFCDMYKIPSNKLRAKAIAEVLEILSGMTENSFSTTDDLIAWANNGFQNFEQKEDMPLPSLVMKHINYMKSKIDEDVISEESDKEDNTEILYENLRSGALKIEELCISCCDKGKKVTFEHPLFIGGLCSSCKEHLKETALALGDDGKNICCVICAEPGFLIVCDTVNCPRAYCRHCMRRYFGAHMTEQIIKLSSWFCFFCSSNEMNDNLLKIRNDWEERLLSLYISENSVVNGITPADFRRKHPINVLSLFDGISTGKLVLDMLGITVGKYYSSEIDADAINVSKLHHKDLITYLGDVCKISEDAIESLGDIDLIIGGSPCNDLSLVNPARKGLFDDTGTGCLFFDFFHILNAVRKRNKNVFYLFENVVAMTQKDKLTISSFFMHEPALIDAKYFSSQTRPRYFWGNIPGLYSLPKYWNSLPSEVMKENLLDENILPNMGRKATVEKIRTVTTQRHSLIQNGCNLMPVIMNGEPDILWVTELEKIFGFPVHYTDTGNLGISKRRELLGRSWSVPVIKNILQPLRSFFECI